MKRKHCWKMKTCNKTAFKTTNASFLRLTLFRLTGKCCFSGTGTSNGISVSAKSLLSNISRLPSSIPCQKVIYHIRHRQRRKFGLHEKARKTGFLPRWDPSSGLGKQKPYCPSQRPVGEEGILLNINDPTMTSQSHLVSSTELIS